MYRLQCAKRTPIDVILCPESKIRSRHALLFFLFAALVSLRLRVSWARRLQFYALIKCVVGGQYGIAFLLYIFFQTFVVTNAITNLFVSALMDTVTRDENYLVTQRYRQKQKLVSDLSKLFRRMDLNGDGLVGLSELRAHATHRQMAVFCTKLEMEEEDLEYAFTMLTRGGAQCIDLDRFVEGCIKLKGDAKALDLIDLKEGQEHLSDQVCKLQARHSDFESHVKKELQLHGSSLLDLHGRHRSSTATCARSWPDYRRTPFSRRPRRTRIWSGSSNA